MTPKSVRTRFAPSPTGSLHIGGLRTALFNWLFARHHGGQFLLRIEDTDQKRFDPTALQTLIEAMKWSGLNWDEGPDIGGPYGPYVQSERLDLYQTWAKWLVDEGKAYKCFCTSERLERITKEKQARKEPPGYDRHCRNLTAEQVAEQESQGLKYVVRFKMPLDGQTVIPDLIRDDVVFENAVQQDAVILKSDGFPTYHLAHVVDDHFMEISHVMRAVEWLPSAPLHINLWYAFGWDRPFYAHLPVMLNPNGQGKMSKRKPPLDKFGNIIPVMVHDYMERGYLPEAMNNFLANIGWSFGEDREVFTMAEAIGRFDLTRINQANSAFPVEKLDWVNGEHLRHLDPTDLATRLRPYLETAGLEVNVDTLLQIIPLVQTRLKTLKDIVDLAGFFFKDYSTFSAPVSEMLIQKKMDAARTLTMLNESIALIESMPTMAYEPMHEAFKGLAERLGVGNGPLFGTLRVALTAQTISTPTFETMEVLGKAESLRRLRMAVARLTEQQPNPSPQD